MNSLKYPAAEKLLKQAIEKDRYYAPALIRLASLYLHEAKQDKALDLLRTVLSLDAYSAEGNYLYGLCNLSLGNMTDAKDGFSLASRSNAFRTAAYEKLGEIHFREGNLAKAQHYAQASLQYNTRNLSALQLLCVIARTSGRMAEAKVYADSMLHVAPLYPASRFEAAQTGLSTLQEFAAAETCEMPQETYQELALWYESIGRYEEAMQLYGLAPNSVMAGIHQSYLLHQEGKETEAKEALSQALAMSPDFVFPFRVEDKPALEYAVANDDSWKSHYYLAELLSSFDAHEEAMNQLKQCGTPDFAPYWQFYSNETTGEERLAALQKAESLSPSWRIGRDLMKYYQAQGDCQNVIKVGKRYHRSYPDNYIISLALAKGYQEAGRNTQCLKLLRSTQVLPYEGSHEGYNVYRKANLQEAAKLARAGKTSKAKEYIKAAKEYPENLGVGKPYNAQLSLDGLKDEDREILDSIQ